MKETINFTFDDRLKKILIVLFGLVLCVSLWFFSNSQAINDLTLFVTQRLDEMRNTVLSLTAASSLSSISLTLLPGDIATPLAENLADISDYLLIVIVGIWLQKFMFSSLGLFTLKFLIPGAILLYIMPIISELIGYTAPFSKKTQILGIKLAMLGTVIFAVVPTTIMITQSLEGSYQSTLDRTLQNADDLDLKLTEENTTNNTEQVAPEEQNLLGKIGSTISGVVNGILQFSADTTTNISTTVTQLPQQLAGLLNNMVESLAILIVVNCVAPFAVLLFLMWIIKLIFGKDLSQSNLLTQKPVGNFVRQRTHHKRQEG